MVGDDISGAKRIIKVMQDSIVNHSYVMEHFNVGDIVHESHFPDRIGVIIKVSRYAATVQWQSTNLYSPHYLSTIETIELGYLEKVEGEIIFNDFDKIGIKKKGPLGGLKGGKY